MMARRLTTGTKQHVNRRRVGRALFSSLLMLVLATIILVPPSTAWAVCACTSGRMTSFPGGAPITIDGNMADWDSIMSNPANNICDGPPITDLDAPIQSTGRDLMQFTYTYDSNYVYAMTQRVASDSNTDNFIYYADTNNNGVMETGEKVIIVGWQGSNQSVDVYIGTYQAYYAGGDPMVCTTGKTAGQTCTPGKADGYHPPGRIINMPSPGQPNYSGKWGSSNGTQMEWRVTWADLGLGASPGQAFTFHVSSTNSQPGAGSFPAQIDDNMGGCGGGGGSSQYAGTTLVPDQLLALTTSTTYTSTHTLTNTGNGNDNYTLTYAISGPNSPSITSVIYQYWNGSAWINFTDTSTVVSSLAPGASIIFTALYTFSGSPQGKGPYYVTTTAKSKFDTSVSAPAIDTLTSQNVITVRNQTNGGYGSFSFGSGTNGLPLSLTLTTTAGNNPDTSQGYVPANTTKTSALTETVPSGWRFNSGACVYAASGTAVAGVTWTNTPPTAGFTIPAGVYTDNINCTFVNDKLPTISLSKLLGAPRVLDADQFTVQLKNGGGSVLASSPTTGTGESVAAGTGTISYTGTGTGITYYLDEVKSAGLTSAAVYAASVSCTNNGVAVATPNALGAGQSFTPGIGDNYVCFITNTPPVLTVKKQSTGGTGVFSFAGTNGVSSGFTLDTSTANPQTASFVLSAINTQTTVTETVPAGWALTGATCVDGANNPVPNTTLANGTLSLPAAAIVAGANLTCTFADSKLPTVQVAKNSTNNTGTFAFAGTNGIAASFNLTTATAGTPVTGSVYTVTSATNVVTITETAPVGWPVNPASASCIDNNAAVSGNPLPPTTFGSLASNVLTIPTANLRPAAQILCSFTNTLAQPTVQVGKTSNNGIGTFAFAGTNGVAASINIATATAGTPVFGSVYTVSTTSTNVTVTETAPAGWPANPVAASCTDTNGTVSGNGAAAFGTLAGNVLTILPANLKAGAQIVCTFFNTLQVPTVQLAKTANGSGTFGYTLANLNNANDSITVSTPLGTAATVTSAVNSTVTSISVAATIQESTVPGGWPINPVSASCVDANGAASGNGGGSFGSLTGNTLTIPASHLKSGAQILCTFTNTAPGTGLVLVKSVDKATAFPGDVLTYTITYSNNGLNSLDNIVITDAVPTYTYNPSASCVYPLPSAITGCTVVTTSASVSWLLNGSLSPSASGQVKFSVIIQQ